MSKRDKFLCTNAEDNCPYYKDSTVITIGGVEKFVCPKNKPSCERDYLVPVAEPSGPAEKFLKKAAIIAVPVIIAGLVWLYFITRPPPPYKINVTYTTPPGAKIHPGDTLSWKLAIEGGKPSDKPSILFDSLTPFVLSKADMKLESVDESGRKFKLTAQTAAEKVGQAMVVVSVAQKNKLPITNNFGFEIDSLGPPALSFQSAQPLVMESGNDSLPLPFVVSDEKFGADKLTFSATVNPTDKVACNVQANGNGRTVTLSRNQRESGLVKLAIHLATPDGRETNQTYDLSVIAPPPPTLAINLASTTPPAESVHPSEEMVWMFTVDGGAASEKPVVVADSLSPSLLPSSALQLVPLDQTSRSFKLTARPTGGATGHVEIRISVSLDGGTKDMTLSFDVVPIPVVPIPPPARPVISTPPPTSKTFAQLMKEAREARRQKHYPEALEDVNQAEQLEPQNLEAWNFKAIIYYSWGHYTDSLNTANQVLGTDPQNADGWFIKGASEEYLVKKREALESYRRFIQYAHPGDPRIADVKNRIQSLMAELNVK